MGIKILASIQWCIRQNKGSTSSLPASPNNPWRVGSHKGKLWGINLGWDGLLENKCVCVCVCERERERENFGYPRVAENLWNVKGYISCLLLSTTTIVFFCIHALRKVNTHFMFENLKKGATSLQGGRHWFCEWWMLRTRWIWKVSVSMNGGRGQGCLI